MSGLLLPIAAIHAVLTLTQFAPSPETGQTHPEPEYAVRVSSVADVSAAGQLAQPAIHVTETMMIRTWCADDEEPTGDTGPSRHASAPEDRPPFPTQVEPRDSSGPNAAWRWSPFGCRSRYAEQRAEERRDWRLGYNSDDMRVRRDRLLSAHEKALRSGVMQLRNADYRRALQTLSMAAELNQADPACRIHLMQAQVALGHYDEASKTLRRALELQPKLAFLNLDLADSFSSAHEWDECVNDLASTRDQTRNRGQIKFLLGYLEYQRGRLDHAHRAFFSAARLTPRDELTRRFLSLTRPARR